MAGRLEALDQVDLGLVGVFLGEEAETQHDLAGCDFLALSADAHHLAVSRDGRVLLLPQLGAADDSAPRLVEPTARGERHAGNGAIGRSLPRHTAGQGRRRRWWIAVGSGRPCLCMHPPPCLVSAHRELRFQLKNCSVTTDRKSQQVLGGAPKFNIWAT